MGYRRVNTSGVATGDAPKTMHMVVDATRYNDKCCFAYGNVETDSKDDNKTMEAVSFGLGDNGPGGAGPDPGGPGGRALAGGKKRRCRKR